MAADKNTADLIIVTGYSCWGALLRHSLISHMSVGHSKFVLSFCAAVLLSRKLLKEDTSVSLYILGFRVIEGVRVRYSVRGRYGRVDYSSS